MNKNKNEEKLLGNIKKKYRDNMSDEQKKTEEKLIDKIKKIWRQYE